MNIIVTESALEKLREMEIPEGRGLRVDGALTGG